MLSIGCFCCDRVAPTHLSMTDATSNQSATPTSAERNRLKIEGKILAKRYLIQSLLARGGFGVTFLARNIYLPGQPLCVIKKLAPKFTNRGLLATARWRFYLEARSLSRLGSHAQIPSLLDYFKIGTDLYLVEEYIPGYTLAQMVRDRRFTIAEIEDFLSQMLRLLEYIHGNRLIHRDLKPDNIILCKTDRRFVSIDFGAVKDLDPTLNARRHNIISRAIGTNGFAPPEQLANRPVYASDLYSLGMTCIYLLTGIEPAQLPIDPYTCEVVWSNNLGLSMDSIAIISKMVAVSIADRYKSATQVIAALNNRQLRQKLRAYTVQKYAIAKTQSVEFSDYFPPVIYWGLAQEVEVVD
jgi:serine/threonine protein kinase